MNHTNKMNTDSSKYQSITAQAWAGMLALLLMMFIADIERLAMQGQYTDLAESLAHDPGKSGLWILVCLASFNAVMQLAVRTFDSKSFRIFVFWVTVVYTTFFILHQVVHFIGGETLGLHTPLDIAHHVLGIWGCWSSMRWIKNA
jgi:hypothetical protein